jgi:hypothetical protein
MSWVAFNKNELQREKTRKAKLCSKCKTYTTNEPDEICVICKVDDQVRGKLAELNKEPEPETSDDVVLKALNDAYDTCIEKAKDYMDEFAGI